MRWRSRLCRCFLSRSCARDLISGGRRGEPKMACKSISSGWCIWSSNTSIDDVRQKRLSSDSSKRRSKFRRPPKTATHRPNLDDRATTSKHQPLALVLPPAPVRNPWRGITPASSPARLPAVTRYAPSLAQMIERW
jgi:hypothetical protein